MASLFYFVILCLYFPSAPSRKHTLFAFSSCPSDFNFHALVRGNDEAENFYGNCLTCKIAALQHNLFESLGFLGKYLCFCVFPIRKLVA